mmetsp:Transcript_27628/g.20037  ORF Transcript_27628/g.20037 Transcript_27628/m.20037 type:complete len:158 (-) Transcript_27628:474-947(-)
MWFCIFDFQHTKEELLVRPDFFMIGLLDLCFSSAIFWKYVLQASCNGLFILLIILWGLDSPTGSADFDGKNGSLWLCGTLVYCSVVWVANLKIYQKTNTHSFFSFFFIFGSIGSFYLFLWVENLYAYFNQVYLIFDPLFGRYQPWAILVCICGFNYF